MLHSRRAMKLPRKGILIRIALYGSLISVFGWQTWDRSVKVREASDEAFRDSLSTYLNDGGINGNSRMINIPNGKSMSVVEIDEEEAARLGLLPDDEDAPSETAEPAADSAAEPAAEPAAAPAADPAAEPAADPAAEPAADPAAAPAAEPAAAPAQPTADQDAASQEKAPGADTPSGEQ